MTPETRFFPLFLIRLGQMTFLGRGRLRRVLLSALGALRVSSVEATFRGVPYIFYLDNPTERKALFGRYNDKELDFLLQHMMQPNSVFVDIGANSGFYTNYLLAKSGADSTVLAIEPNQQMAARIRRNSSLLDGEQRGSKRLLVEQKAISDHSGVAFLNLEMGLGSADLVKAETAKSIRVETVPLFDLLAHQGISKIDALKIDVEGHEDKALLPFLEAADEAMLPRSIVIEHTSRERWGTDVIERLFSAGYRVADRTRGNLLLAK